MFVRLRNYFQTAYAELQKVIWPSRRDVVNHTMVIVLSVIGAIIFLGVIDYLLTLFLKNVIF